MGRRLGYATVAVLRAIQAGARHGLEIMQQTGLPSGTVYPTLARMEARGFVTGHWEDRKQAHAEGRPARRYYRVTADGRAAIHDALDSYGALGVWPPEARGLS